MSCYSNTTNRRPFSNQTSDDSRPTFCRTLTKAFLSSPCGHHRAAAYPWKLQTRCQLNQPSLELPAERAGLPLQSPETRSSASFRLKKDHYKSVRHIQRYFLALWDSWQFIERKPNQRDVLSLQGLFNAKESNIQNAYREIQAAQ